MMEYIFKMLYYSYFQVFIDDLYKLFNALIVFYINLPFDYVLNFNFILFYLKNLQYFLIDFKNDNLNQCFKIIHIK